MMTKTMAHTRVNEGEQEDGGTPSLLPPAPAPSPRPPLPAEGTAAVAAVKKARSQADRRCLEAKIARIMERSIECVLTNTNDNTPIKINILATNI